MYYKGLTVEFYDKESGYWIKPKGARNEPLDTAVYAIWASLAPAVKADVIRDSQWEALEQQYQPTAPGLFDAPQDSRETLPPTVAPSHPPALDSRGTPTRPRAGGFAREGWGL
ncbi:phage terminase large subunit family protein [Xanthomonas arboricola pv. corylina]|nr:phage terminase large subunit family protein [Xanthomonas arboricola pv. corylina]